MKRTFIQTLSCLLLAGMAMTSCEDKDKETNNPLSAPQVRIDSAGGIRVGAATVYGSVFNSGNLLVQGKGILYSDTAAEPGFKHLVKAATGDGGGVFSVLLTGLKPRTTYRARFYARNYIDTSYSIVFTFFSAPTLGSVAAASALEVGRDTVKVSSTLTGNGAETILDRGFIIGRASNPQINTKQGDYNFLSVDNDSTKGTSFVGIVRNLEPGKTYYLRPYVRNRGGIGYGPQAVVTTQP